MYSQREQISMKSKLESIEAQLNYIKVQINEIDAYLRVENKKNDQLIEEQFEKLNLTNCEIERANINFYYNPLHEAFCSSVCLKQAEKKKLIEEQKKLFQQQEHIQDALSSHN